MDASGTRYRFLAVLRALDNSKKTNNDNNKTTTSNDQENISDVKTALQFTELKLMVK